MQLSNSPVKIPLPFAASGLKNTIPEASQIGIVAGAASLTDGFPPLTRTPLASGGIPVAPGDMNGILFSLSAVIRWANAGGGYAFDGTFAADANVGGYPKGARVMRSDGLGYWFNTAENNATDPEGAGAIAAGWVPDFTTGATAVTMTGSNVTLTALQYGKPVIVISGLLTANLNLIFPNIVGEWTVINNTTGAFLITGKTAAGTGAIVSGIMLIVGDGTNILTPSVSASPVVGVSRNLKMSVSTASSSATMTADEIIVESILGGLSAKLVSFNKTVNLATTGAGGMDTGTAPVSGYVSLYTIYNPTTQTSALLACNSATSNGSVYSGANMPSGYTLSALVSSWGTTASSQFKAGYQSDRKCWIIYAAIITGSTSTPYVSASLAAVVPPNAKAWSGVGYVNVNSGSTTADLMSVAGDANGIGVQVVQTVGASSASIAVCGNLSDVPIITSQVAYWNSSNTSGASFGVTSYTF